MIDHIHTMVSSKPSGGWFSGHRLTSKGLIVESFRFEFSNGKQLGNNVMLSTYAY